MFEREEARVKSARLRRSRWVAQQSDMNMGGLEANSTSECQDESGGFRLLRKASEKRWPDAVMTNSGIVLAFAKIAGREALQKTKWAK